MGFGGEARTGGCMTPTRFFGGIPHSFFSRILDSNAQYSGFNKRKLPGFLNPNHLPLGDLVMCYVGLLLLFMVSRLSLEKT